MKYVEDVYKDEAIRIRQSFQIQLEHMHKNKSTRIGQRNTTGRKLLQDNIKRLSHRSSIGLSPGQFIHLNARRSSQAKKNERRSAAPSRSGSIFADVDNFNARKDCQEDQTIQMSVKLTMNKIKLVCIHP